MDLAAIPSPTGEEAELADFIVEWFAERGIATHRQEVEEGRGNAVGIVRGRGSGPSIMFNGHMDTLTMGGHEDVRVPPAPVSVMPPRIDEGVLYGTGMDNMKSALAAIMGAAGAVHESSVALQGDVIVAAVAGEIGLGPVDQYQGRNYRSKGVGTRFLLTHGILSDYAVVADTSHFGLTWAQCGVVYAKISTSGRALYTPFTRRVSDPRESDNAIIKMTKIVEALERWGAEYEEKNIYSFGGGEIRPKVSIGAIAGGAPFRASNSPPSCSIYVDVRIPPNRLPIEIQREMTAALQDADIDYSMELFVSQRGYEHTDVEPLVDAVRESHRLVRGTPPPTIDPSEASMWTDTNLYYEAGIPAVKFGIGGILVDSPDGFLHNKMLVRDTTSISDLVDATKMYAAVAALVCGVT